MNFKSTESVNDVGDDVNGVGGNVTSGQSIKELQRPLNISDLPSALKQTTHFTFHRLRM